MITNDYQQIQYVYGSSTIKYQYFLQKSILLIFLDEGVYQMSSKSHFSIGSIHFMGLLIEKSTKQKIYLEFHIFGIQPPARLLKSRRDQMFTINLKKKISSPNLDIFAPVNHLLLAEINFCMQGVQIRNQYIGFFSFSSYEQCEVL